MTNRADEVHLTPRMIGMVELHEDEDDLEQYMDPLPQQTGHLIKPRHLALMVITGSMLGILVALSVAGDMLHRQRTKIVRQINAAFEPAWQRENYTIQALMLVEHSYSTLNAQNPYWDDPASADHTISLWRIEDPTDLKKRVLIMRFNEETSNAGSMQYGYVYYLPFQGRVVCMYRGVPSVMKFMAEPDAAERDAQGINRNWKNVMKPFSISNSELQDIFGPVPQQYTRTIIRRDPLPSPNGHLVAIVVTAIETEDAVQFHTYTAVTFYDLRNLLYIGGRKLDLNNDQLDLRLTPAANNSVIKQPYYCLWSQDSTGVYLMDHSDAWFIHAVQPLKFENSPTVPKFAVPTLSGVVNDQGLLAGIRLSGNNASIAYSQLDNWVPFHLISLIEHGTETYSEPVPGTNYTIIKGD